MQPTRILFIYPPSEISVTNTATYCLPLGLGMLTTVGKQTFKDQLKTKILDGSLMTIKEQLTELELFRPNIVGISPTIGSMNNAYQLAHQAKKSGALVIFGGVHSTNLWQQILSNNTDVDAVVLFEGEQAIIKIIWRWQQGQNLTGIDNVACRINNQIRSPEWITVFPINVLPELDYELFDLQKHFEHTQKRGFGRTVSYVGGKGCPRRGLIDPAGRYQTQEYLERIKQMPACTFCGRNELGFRTLSAEREKTLLHRLHNKLGVRGFFNVHDSVSLSSDQLIGLNDCWFRLFIGVNEITPSNISRLQQHYGHDLIFQVGFEAVDQTVRKSLGKPTLSPGRLKEKVELLAQKNIQLHASFILGGRNETLRSMEATLDFILWLAKQQHVTWLLVSPQLILPGSPDYRRLLNQPGMQDKWGSADLIDIPDIHQDFLKFFAPTIDRKTIVKKIGETFAKIRQFNNWSVLDVKGVMPAEETIIQPRHNYCR